MKINYVLMCDCDLQKITMIYITLYNDMGAIAQYLNQII